MEVLQADNYVEMLLNLYGNYVIQKALSEAMEPELTVLIKVDFSFWDITKKTIIDKYNRKWNQICRR